MKIVMVGQGAFGQKHLDAIAKIPGIEVVSLCGGSPGTTREVAQARGIPHWTTDLAEIPGKHGVSNVYADLGQIFAQTTVTEPRLCAVMMGQHVKGLGADHVVWGSDAIWTGAPQWQIEALRRMEIPEDIRTKYGFAPMGGADSAVKRAILGENNARIYGFTPALKQTLLDDRVAQCKRAYDALGGDRTNLAYGYALKS